MINTRQAITTGAENFQIEDVGSTVLRINTSNGPGTLKMEEVLYVPKFMANIVSMDRIIDQMLIWDAARSITSKANQNCYWNAGDYFSLFGTLRVYFFNSSSVRKVSSADVVVWRRRLGHPSPSTIKKLRTAVAGVKVTGSYDGYCDGCLLSKSKRIVSRIPADRGDNHWTRMHVDLIKFQKAWNGENYVLNAYDAKSRGHLVETLSSKDQLTLSRSIMSMIQMSKKEDRIVRFLHNNNEKGFGSHFKQMLQDEGIKFENKVPYTPEQIGFAESSGNRICVVARSLRINSGLPEELWPELVRTAVYLLNKTPNEGLNWIT
ncbi:hypothetical protein K3495_g11092 [Podosphaera aphanis]|nr:hypothetical protein K3495_g11092 [Podosphaera aphanis]